MIPSDNQKQSVGLRIKEARSALGLTQKELCDKTGMPLQSLRGYELSHRTPGGDAIEYLVRIGINANWLLTGEGEMLLSDVQPRPASSISPPGFDRSRFLLAIEAVEEGLEAADRTMSPDKKAELFLAVYDLMEEPANTKARVLQLVRLAA